jgi:hypothetical protein
MNYEMNFELLQPWSTFVMKTQLPPPILEKMIKISDEIVENRAGKGDNVGAGQLEEQFHLPLEILEQEEVMGFFLDIMKHYITEAYLQSEPFRREEIINESWNIHTATMWINSQKDNEYFPSHFHERCALSSVMYLKIPEYLPSRISYGNIEEDGSIEFSGLAHAFQLWGVPQMTIQPRVGDFFIFSAHQYHQVYPFRTPDGKGERRSVSFNADFSREKN